MRIERQVDKLNPFSSKGRLSFSSFVITLFGAVLANVAVYIVIRAQLIPVRAAVDRDRAIVLYGTWILLAIAGFAVVSNTFIKRWSAILGRDPGRFWRAVIRFSLLSPLLSYPMTAVTLLFFPQGPIEDVESGGSGGAILTLLAAVLLASILAAAVMPASWFGLETIDFRTSIQPYAGLAFENGKNSVPSRKVLKPILAAATPGGRYLAWIASDFVRANALQTAIRKDPASVCLQRMGFMKVEVEDCYFANLRKVAAVAPFVIPYFPLYFEGQYRKEVIDDLARNTTRTAMQGFAADMVMISNNIELIEPGPMFVERKHFLRPAPLLHAFGSPEVAFVEAGQDMQRMTLIQKVLPSFDEQIRQLGLMIEEVGPTMGPDEVTVRAEYRDLQMRVAAIKRDPLMLGKK